MFLKLCLVFVLCGLSRALVTRSDYKLEQVFIFSRHSARTPLGQPLLMKLITQKTWPEFNVTKGHLTEKGALLEGYMGEYFYQWLNEQKLLPVACPTEQDFYVYSNTKQRTKATAKAFVTKAFPNCSVVVHHKDSKEDDPMFSSRLNNSTIAFRKLVKQAMEEKLEGLRLNESYNEVERLLDFKTSSLCKVFNICKLSTLPSASIVLPGLEPVVIGPLVIAYGAVDAFLMQYYEGMPDQEVAWGQIKDPSDWSRLLDAQKGLDHVIFNTTFVARDIGKLLLNYISDTFKNESRKITLLVGHDSNIHTIISSLRSKPYDLPEQHENAPIGGKLVFQKWYDSSKKRYLLRVDYVYQTSEQLRNAEALSLDRPPRSYMLELDGCKVDSDGFCLWDDFMQLLNDIVN